MAANTGRKKLFLNAGDAVGASQDANAFAHNKGHIGLLNHRNHVAVIEPDGDFESVTPGDSFFPHVAGYSADNGAANCGQRGTSSMANGAACHSAGNTARHRADTGLGAFNLNTLDKFDSPKLQGLDLSRLIAGIHFTGTAGCATAQQSGKGQKSDETKNFHNTSLFFNKTFNHMT
jgi:hypothetical protein